MTFVVTLRATPGVNADCAMRLVLKYAKHCGLRCVRITTDPLELEPAPERDVADEVVKAARHSNDVASDG